ncbi:tellurium resistance protein [Pseudotabrizicola sp.]|nr:tellurium resistance protein [Pseudotabrizicola sp.]MDO8882163.1 tellurium resistance protein [Pseudotabrizicola sp.]MDP2082678.1 tellurium resistance protein [Pseudotabrizicola sp.]
MSRDPNQRRPKMFPPPEFPPRKLPLFARMPPAVFPVVLGMLGLALALKRASIVAQVPEGLADLVMGLVAGLWLFCTLAYAIKIARRPGVVTEDLRILPGRAGLAAATVGALAFAAMLGFFAPQAAKGVLVLGLVLQGALALLMVRSLLAAPPEGRDVTPVWHLAFVGFIVGALAAVPLGWEGLALIILWTTMPVAVGIWGVSLWQLALRIPPAPLRPLLAIHLAPASLFASVAGLLGMTFLAQAMVVLAFAIAIALLVVHRWIGQAGFTPLWGAFTFPAAAFASALLINGWVMGGVLVTVLTLGAIPAIALRVLRMWTAGTLASKTNAATA